MDEPTVLEMGEIIWSINGGSVRGLRAMGFIPDNVPVPQGSRKYDLGVVQKAFRDYHAWIVSNTSDQERQRWRWSLVTEENYLWQYEHVSELIDALDSA